MIRNTRAAADVQLPRRIAASVPGGAGRKRRRGSTTWCRISWPSRYRPAEGPAGAADGARFDAAAGRQQSTGDIRPFRGARFERGALGAGRRPPGTGGHPGAGLRHRGERARARIGTPCSPRIRAKPWSFTESWPTPGSPGARLRGTRHSYSLFSGDFSRAEKVCAIALFRDQAAVPALDRGRAAKGATSSSPIPS